MKLNTSHGSVRSQSKIDSLQADLPQPIDPRLKHYLERKSYDKALELLERKMPDVPGSGQQ